MKTNCLLACLAVLAVVAGRSASTRGDGLQPSDFDVQMASFEQAPVIEDGPIHAAFLSDGAGPQHHARLASHRILRNGLTSGRGDDCPECSLGYKSDYQCGETCECGGTCQCGAPSCSSDGWESCPSCGCQSGCESREEAAYLSATSDIQRRQLYGEVQVVWMRAHIMEDAIGKLSEQYKFSPRLIVGYEDPCGIGARLRYWHYDHTTETLGSSDFLNLGFDVADAELTSRFAMRKTDLVVSGGARWASIDIGLNDEFINTDMMIGLTVAADLRTQICGGCNRQWAGVAGGRWSTLGGNWEGSSQSLIPEVRDDNVVVQELYAGVEYMCCTRRGHNLYARLTFEIQNWHSDAMSQLGGTDSIGFVGPGIHVGGAF